MRRGRGLSRVASGLPTNSLLAAMLGEYLALPVTPAVSEGVEEEERWWVAPEA